MGEGLGPPRRKRRKEGALTLEAIGTLLKFHKHNQPALQKEGQKQFKTSSFQGKMQHLSGKK